MSIRVILFLSLIFVSGCNNEKIEPRTKVVTRGVEVGDFNRIEFSGIGSLVIKKGNTPALWIDAENNLQTFLDAKVIGKTLYIDNPSARDDIPSSEPIVYTATVRELKKLVHRGKGVITAKEQFSGESLILDLSGEGKIQLDIIVQNLDVDLTHEAKLILTGLAEKQQVNISGQGSYLARDLVSKTASVYITGQGKAVLNVKDRLDGSITGKGFIEYMGSPETNIQTFGGGKVKKIGN